MKNLTGTPAIPFALTDSSGRMHRVEEYRGSWLLMVFHRHLGWLPCRAHLTQLRERETEFEQLGLRVVVVTFAHDFLARSYVEDTALAWPLLIDSQREVYRSYGMLTASFWDVWGPKTLLVYARELSKGVKLEKSEDDIYQRGGDVLIDPQGIIRLHHVGSGPADRPEVDLILGKISGSTHRDYR